MAPGLVYACFYDSVWLFKHILTDFEFFRFVCIPLPPAFSYPLDRCEIVKISLESPDFTKIQGNFEDFPDTFGRRARVYKNSKKSKIAKNGFKYLQSDIQMYIRVVGVVKRVPCLGTPRPISLHFLHPKSSLLQ